MSHATRSVADQIEFLTPRDAAFGGDSPAEFAGFDPDDLPADDDLVPRSTWLTAGAALAVVALLGVGVVAAAPWQSSPSKGAPPATTIVPPETAPNAGPTEPLGEPVGGPVTATTVAGWVFDPLPAGFVIRGAWRDNSAPVQHPIPGWGEVWATPTATATGGSWFSVTLLNHALDTVSADATRVDLGVSVAVLERAAGGTWRLSAPIGHTDSSQVLTVRSSGRSTDDLIALFQSIGIDDDRPQMVDDRPTYLDPAQLAGYERVASQATDQDLIDAYLGGSPTSSTTYANGAGDGYITINTAALDVDLEPLGRLAVGPARIFPSNASVPSSFAGKDLVIGAAPGGNGTDLIARWIEDDTVVVLRTNLPLGDLLDLMPTARPTSAREWNSVQKRVDQTDPVQVLAAGGTPFAGGVLDDGSAWSATVQPPDRAVLQIDGSIVSFQVPDGSPGRSPFQVSTFPQHTVVTAITPTDSTATTLQVTADDHLIAVATMLQLDASDRRSSFSGLAAGLAFVETGPFDVDLLGADGQVLAHFASPGFST